MSLLTIGKKAKNAEPLLEYRQHPKLIAAQQRLDAVNAELASLLADSTKRAAVDAAQAALDEVEIQALAGRAADSDLAKAQASLLAAKQALAVVTVRIRDLETERQKLVSDTVPAETLRGKVLARDNLRAAYLQTMRDMLASLEGIPAHAAKLANLRQLALKQFPHSYDTGDPSIDRRFASFASLPLLAESSRVIRHAAGGVSYMDTEVKDAAELSLPLIKELHEAIAAVEKAISKEKVK